MTLTLTIMNILDQVRSAEQATNRSLLAEYAKLLTKEKPTGTDAQRLHQVMRQIGKTAAMAEADTATLERHASLSRFTDEHIQSLHEDLTGAVLAIGAERDAEKVRRQAHDAKILELSHAESDARRDHVQATKFREQRHELERDNAELLQAAGAELLPPSAV